MSSKGKVIASQFALSFVQNGMTVGLGTGSTTLFFIQALGEKFREGGLQIRAIATSIESEKCAQSYGIPIVDAKEVESIDLAIDGADEVDSTLSMIKGGGGALLREKIIASASEKVVIIVDDSKIVETLGAFPLPLEVVPFGYRLTMKALKQLGYEGVLRMSGSTPYCSDSGHYIIDLQNIGPITNPLELHQKLINVVGVIETGLFVGIANEVIVGYDDGHHQILR